MIRMSALIKFSLFTFIFSTYCTVYIPLIAANAIERQMWLDQLQDTIAFVTQAPSLLNSNVLVYPHLYLLMWMHE